MSRIRPPARTAALLGLLVLVGFVVRIDALRNSAPAVPELGDATAYHLLAQHLADGEGYIRPYEFAIDGTTVQVTDADGDVDIVSRVEQFRFLGTGETYELQDGALALSADTADLDDLLHDHFLEELIASETGEAMDAGDATMAPMADAAGDAAIDADLIAA